MLVLCHRMHGYMMKVAVGGSKLKCLNDGSMKFSGGKLWIKGVFKADLTPSI